MNRIPRKSRSAYLILSANACPKFFPSSKKSEASASMLRIIASRKSSRLRDACPKFFSSSKKSEAPLRRQSPRRIPRNDYPKHRSGNRSSRKSSPPRFPSLTVIFSFSPNPRVARLTVANQLLAPPTIFSFPLSNASTTPRGPGSVA